MTEQKTRNDTKSEIHVAASHGHINRLRALTLQGAKVDELSNDGKTPLMLALISNVPYAVDFLLSQHANIHVTDNNGETSLQILFRSKNVFPQIIESFLRVMQNQYRKPEELLERLFNAGCTLYHAAFLGDTQVLRGLLERGVRDIDSTYYWHQTALHVASKWNDLELVSCLVNVGANVNALDAHGRGALLAAVSHGNPRMVEFLLEHGADPNARALDCGLTPLLSLIFHRSRPALTRRNYDECAELLFRYGAVPLSKIGNREGSLFDEALCNGDSYVISLAICYLALRGLEATVECKWPNHRIKLVELKENYKGCLRVLRVKVFEKLTLFDLLTMGERKFRAYAQRKSFCRTVRYFLIRLHCMYDRSYRYYEIILEDRLKRTPDVQSQNEAVLVVCRIFGGSYELCQIFAREIVEYLDKQEIEQLCRA